MSRRQIKPAQAVIACLVAHVLSQVRMLLTALKKTFIHKEAE